MKTIYFNGNFINLRRTAIHLLIRGGTAVPTLSYLLLPLRSVRPLAWRVQTTAALLPVGDRYMVMSNLNRWEVFELIVCVITIVRSIIRAVAVKLCCIVFAIGPAIGVVKLVRTHKQWQHCEIVYSFQKWFFSLMRRYHTRTLVDTGNAHDKHIKLIQKQSAL